MLGLVPICHAPATSLALGQQDSEQPQPEFQQRALGACPLALCSQARARVGWRLLSGAGAWHTAAGEWPPVVHMGIWPTEDNF